MLTISAGRFRGAVNTFKILWQCLVPCKQSETAGGRERRIGGREGEREVVKSAHRHGGACHLPLFLVFSISGVVGGRGLLELARLESEEDASFADAHVTNQHHLVQHGVS